MSLSRILVAAIICISVAISGALEQSVFPDNNYSQGLFTPIESLAFVTEEIYTTLTHPFFPNYSARIKKTVFCDPTVNSYTGYIDIQARHLFFYFFESRNDPSKDDVIFWTNGGPGCSSSMGLFMELGPCRVLDSNETKFHPESWNTNANIFFIDQPIGVGFSYADYGETVGTTEDAAKDIASFVAIFFENFSQFKGRPFHMAGESYGGRYLPLFASAVYDQNVQLTEAGLQPINLSSVMIGNGLTDEFTMALSYYDMACTAASIAPIGTIADCVATKNILARCDKWMTKSCVESYDAINCGAAVSFCEDALWTPYNTAQKNPYDISQSCSTEELQEYLCYPATRQIANYLDKPAIRKMLGVDPGLTSNFSSCSNDVAYAFSLSGDSAGLTYHYVGALLERGIKVLIYVGEYDFICNWVGNERWTLALEWSGQEEFRKTPLSEWTVDGKAVGKTRKARNLTFVTIAQAGHMVPYDKPTESLEMVRRWLADEEFQTHRSSKNSQRKQT